MIDKIKEICDGNHVSPIVILKTPLVGETVDNGMGVDFDLKEYALIFKYDKGYTMLNSELSHAFYELERESDAPGFGVMNMDVEGVTSIDDIINELNERDKYEVIWRDESYKDPDKYKAELFRDAISVSLNVTKTYSLKVKFSEIIKYCSNKSSGYAYKSDFFNDVLRDHIEFDEVVNNRTFPGDSAKMKDFHFSEDGIVFVFECEFVENTVCDSDNYTDDQLTDIIKKFEHTGDGVENNHDALVNVLRESFEAIINGEESEKGKSHPRVNVSRIAMGRKRV